MFIYQRVSIVRGIGLKPWSNTLSIPQRSPCLGRAANVRCSDWAMGPNSEGLFWVEKNHETLVGGWPTPLKNDGVSQLGWVFPSEWKVIKIPWFLKAPTRTSSGEPWWTSQKSEQSRSEMFIHRGFSDFRDVTHMPKGSMKRFAAGSISPWSILSSKWLPDFLLVSMQWGFQSTMMLPQYWAVFSQCNPAQKTSKIN